MIPNLAVTASLEMLIKNAKNAEQDVPNAQNPANAICALPPQLSPGTSIIMFADSDVTCHVLRVKTIVILVTILLSSAVPVSKASLTTVSPTDVPEAAKEKPAQLTPIISTSGTMKPTQLCARNVLRATTAKDVTSRLTTVPPVLKTIRYLMTLKLTWEAVRNLR